MSDTILVKAKPSSSRTTRETEDVFADHLTKRLAGDVEGDINANYSPDVVLLTESGTLLGHEGVRQSASMLEGRVKDAKFSYNKQLVYREYAYLEWSARSDRIEVTDGADSFVIQDGLIVFQSIYYTVKDKQ